MGSSEEVKENCLFRYFSRCETHKPMYTFIRINQETGGVDGARQRE